ncbi:restriction endonuclease subunit S [Propioniciclava coleopterorum]|uniref:Restriction endonuclease subunit S n=1 Tax=Propioniciclava coleopterorum TaxID=2714937 RepID=A0A6G7Y7J7_9ACTN|nr:restriction endonuclease subunit S [Propioniciclava coleopterorum]QIK72601.1 restriction endonuclease subunit S [Propioniciclava coleopterorum]
MKVDLSLGEILDNFDSKRVPVTASQRIAGPYPYYGASGIVDWVDGFLFEGDYLLIAEDGENLRSRSTPVAFLAKGQFWVNNHAHVVRGKPGVADTRFLAYLLAVTDISGYLTGSTQPKLSQASMNSIRVRLPSFAEQQAISEVLGALDDKIAANTELIATCLGLSRALHARVLQQEATSDTLYTEVASVGGGATPSTKRPEYWDGDVPWAVPSDITALGAPYLDDTPRHITAEGFAACSSPLYPVGSILMTSRATIGAFAVNQVPTAVNQGFIVVTPHEDTHRWWLLHEMERRVPEYLNRANGATFLELPRGVFKTMHFDLPDTQVLEQFHQQVDPIHARALAASRESRTLAELRDTLLPALMDGTIKVKDAVASAEEVL